MRPPIKHVHALSLCAVFFLAACAEAEKKTATQAHFSETVNAQTFLKGNIHAHTSKSDGNVRPEIALKWFKKHGYSFAVITDHDKLTQERSLDDRSFVTLNGVEITGIAAGKKPVHVNAICGSTALQGIQDASRPISEVLQAEIELSRKDGAITLVNHPNYEWAIGASDLLATDGFELLEIASGSPLVHDGGDSSHPSQEELWDTYMTKKHRIYGAAADDSHNYSTFNERESNPGRAWINVWAPELSAEAICKAIREGHFYSSRGTKISALVVTPRTLELAVEHWDPSVDRIDFIGAGGQLLDRVTTTPARYTLRGGEGYVRAHVYQGIDKKTGAKREAWTQAYFIKYD